MHLTISRILGFSMAVAMLGLVACAPKPNPEPFQEPTPAETVTETAAPAEGAATPEAAASPASEGESAQATASPAAEGETANAENAAPPEAAPAAEGELVTAVPSTPANVELIIEADKVTFPEETVALTGPVTFSVVNKTSSPHKFHVEGIKGAVIEKIPSGETGTLTQKIGPGKLAVTVTDLETVAKPETSPVKTVFLKFEEIPVTQHPSKAEVVK